MHPRCVNYHLLNNRSQLNNCHEDPREEDVVEHGQLGAGELREPLKADRFPSPLLFELGFSLTSNIPSSENFPSAPPPPPPPSPF